MSEQDLDAFPPAAHTVRAGGEDLSITPFQVGDVPAVLRAVRSIEPMFAAKDAPVEWMAIMAEHGDDLIDMVAIGTRKPVEWVRRLAMDDFLQLAAVVYRVNLDFFVQRLGPSLLRTIAALNGPSPSAASSQPDTRART